MKAQPIACDLHDYIEIACLYGYQLRLTLDNQQVIEGKAKDILTNSEKQELLILDNQHQVELSKLLKMQVLTEHAKFQTIQFKEEIDLKKYFL